MASVQEMNGTEAAPDTPDKRQKKHDSGAADLEKVTDFQEETELHNIANVNNILKLTFFN